MAAGEFDLIRRYFSQAELATVGRVSGDGGSIRLGIGDDCALIRPDPGEELAISTDTLVEGVHFPDFINPHDLGYRCLAVNLSDLAAMGARPLCFFLAISLPQNAPSWLNGFSRGLRAAASAYGIRLTGGDTTRGPLVITLQVVGTLPCGKALLRQGAGPGDLIAVTGHLGDAGEGLRLAADSCATTGLASVDYLLGRYLRPTPRLKAGRALVSLASSAIDISDGLLADLSHILKASGVGAELDLSRLPLSSQLLAVAGTARARELALSAGDDYELCFTVPVEKADLLKATLDELSEPFSIIGRINEYPGSIRRQLADGKWEVLGTSGFQHFSG